VSIASNTSNTRDIDTVETTFGVRHTEFSAEKGFLLNGVPTKLQGGCVHHDNGINFFSLVLHFLMLLRSRALTRAQMIVALSRVGALGSRAIDRAEERRVETLKANGYNAIRTSHNPVSQAFVAACDKLGVLLMEEAFDCWYDFLARCCALSVRP